MGKPTVLIDPLLAASHADLAGFLGVAPLTGLSLAKPRARKGVTSVLAC